MITSKALLAGATLAVLLATAPASQAAKWSLFGLGGQESPPPDAGNQTTGVAQADPARIDQLEAQVRDLTGQVETLTHNLALLQDQLKRMQDDSEFRFSQLEGGKPVARAAPPASIAPPAPQQQVVTAEPLAVPDNSVVKLDAPLAGAGDTPLDAPPPGANPLDLSSLANGANGTADAGTVATADTGVAAGTAPPAAAPVQTASLGGSGDSRTDYEQAYGLINGGQYDLAAQAFRKFLVAYPKDELAPDAQYWLGESLFAHGDYASAAEEFKTGFQNYPKSKRAPDSLLKLGLSMAGLGYRTEACKMYALALKQYPQMPNGLRQRVKTEQASAAC